VVCPSKRAGYYCGVEMRFVPIESITRTDKSSEALPSVAVSSEIVCAGARTHRAQVFTLDIPQPNGSCVTGAAVGPNTVSFVFNLVEPLAATINKASSQRGGSRWHVTQDPQSRTRRGLSGGFVIRGECGSSSSETRRHCTSKQTFSNFEFFEM
jgi:hypothetical protein